MAFIENYRKIKQQFPDYVLLYKVGDFYEALDNDARIFADTCEIVLTTRPFNGKALPLAGVPYHSITGYINRLLGAGYKVALADTPGALATNSNHRNVLHVTTG